MMSDDDRLARDLATEAGRRLLALRSAGGDPDMLREAGDRRSHEFLAAELARLRPDDAVLSEEGATIRPGCRPAGYGSSTRWTARGSSATPAGRTGPCTSRCGSSAS